MQTNRIGGVIEIRVGFIVLRRGLRDTTSLCENPFGTMEGHGVVAASSLGLKVAITGLVHAFVVLKVQGWAVLSAIYVYVRAVGERNRNPKPEALNSFEPYHWTSSQPFLAPTGLNPFSPSPR